MIQVKFVRLDAEAKAPTRGSKRAAGWDLHSRVDTTIPACSTQRVHTGIAVEIPAGYEGQVRPRSGLATHSGVTVLNSPGTIDADFRGEIVVLLHNISQFLFTVRRGDRIAQLVIAPVPEVEFIESDSLTATERGPGAFGSTGI